ncbi:MAG: hypothetical protein DWQ19_11955 [Crenarchaeota archaeon]|nr:MAG: hypothetical protein DWQ19_11955 [Thermoproteota archaeon]
MPYYVLRKNGQVFDIIADDSKTIPDINKMLFEGTIDQVEKIDDFDAVKDLLSSNKVDDKVTVDENQFDKLVRNITNAAELVVKEVTDKLETMPAAEKVKKAGQKFLDEVRAVHKKAMDQAKKNGKQ